MATVYHRTTHKHTDADPVVLAEQRAAWRRCLYAETRGKASIERLAAAVARMEREGAGR